MGQHSPRASSTQYVKNGIDYFSNHLTFNSLYEDPLLNWLLSDSEALSRFLVQMLLNPHLVNLHKLIQSIVSKGRRVNSIKN
jgi:hypothetical protein